MVFLHAVTAVAVAAAPAVDRTVEADGCETAVGGSQEDILDLAWE